MTPTPLPASGTHDGKHNFNDGADRMTCVLCGYLVREGEPTDPVCPGVKPASPQVGERRITPINDDFAIVWEPSGRALTHAIPIADADLLAHGRERIADLETRVRTLRKMLAAACSPEEEKRIANLERRLVATAVRIAPDNRVCWCGTVNPNGKHSLNCIANRAALADSSPG
jgi:rubredoxin